MKKLFTLVCLLAVAAGNVNAQCPSGESEVTVTINTDNYGEETTWTLTGPGGSPEYANGPSSGTYADNATITVDVCVPDGPVIVFTIMDAYGDGICCQYGNGSYTVTAGGNTVASGGEFETSEESMFVTGPQSALDIAALSITMAPVFSQGSQNITGSVGNFGTTPVTSFEISYAIDNGTPVTQTINATIAPGATYNFTHPTAWDATAGLHEVNVWTSMPNGSSDENSANDMVTADVSVATQTVTRKTIVEEFTSSTCAPCASLNQTFDPLLSSLNTNVAGSNVLAVKYQMNWPSPGNDPSYNSDGNTRKSYYGVSGIPDVFLDGADPTGTNYNAAINNAQQRPAFCDITISHSLNGASVTVDVTVTPYADFPGTHKLFIAATQDHYYYPASTTSQDHFHYAMRKMLPNGQGITLSNLTAGVPQTFTQSYTFTSGTVSQNSYTLWNADINEVTLIAFVQNVANRSILQGAMSDIVTGLNEVENEAGLMVFPNPTEGLVNIGVDLPSATNLKMNVYNVVGELVFSANQGVGAGRQMHTLDLSELANGTYMINIQGEGVATTRQITIAR